MAFQVRMGSLVIIAKNAADAIVVFDRFSERRATEQVSLCDMAGKPVDVEALRAAANLNLRDGASPGPQEG